MLVQTLFPSFRTTDIVGPSTLPADSRSNKLDLPTLAEATLLQYIPTDSLDTSAGCIASATSKVHYIHVWYMDYLCSTWR